MELTRSSRLVPHLRILDTAVSTNDSMLAIAADEPDFSVIVTDSQSSGRGRLGREWVTPPGTGIAVSVLLRPRIAPGVPLGIDRFGWLPLIAGVAMARAVDALVGGQRTTLKWPNDVLIDGLKVSGLLAELATGGAAVVIGAGLNLTQSRDQLPVPTATSLALAGVAADDIADTALSGFLRALRDLVDDFLAGGGDPRGSGILDTVSAVCSTIGREVRVTLPSAPDLVGVATGIDETGRLLVRRDSDAAIQAVAAGDVTHLRYE